MTAEDSLRRVAAAAFQAHLTALDTVRENFEGPDMPAGGTGEVSRGDRLRTDGLSDTIKSVVNAFEKLNSKIDKAQQDSTTPYGMLLSRFKVLDAQHKYLSATYTSGGHLLTFHSEVTQDDKHEIDYDLYFDQGKLRYIRQRRTSTLDDDEQDLLTDDSYYMAGGTVLYSYRDEGHAQPQRDHMDRMLLSRYSLHGDISGSVARAFETFQKDYQLLLSQPLEVMVYTPSVRMAAPEAGPDKKGVDRNGRPAL